MTRSSFPDAGPGLLLAAVLVFVLAACGAGPTAAADGSATQDDANTRPAVTDDDDEPAPAAALPEEGVAADEGDEEDEESPAQLAQFGGAVAASAELCGKPYEAAALVARKAKQKDLYVTAGGDPAQYEADFQAGHARGKAEYLALDAGRRQEFCGRIDSWR